MSLAWCGACVGGRWIWLPLSAPSWRDPLHAPSLEVRVEVVWFFPVLWGLRASAALFCLLGVTLFCGFWWGPPCLEACRASKSAPGFRLFCPQGRLGFPRGFGGLVSFGPRGGAEGGVLPSGCVLVVGWGGEAFVGGALGLRPVGAGPGLSASPMP